MKFVVRKIFLTKQEHFPTMLEEKETPAPLIKKIKHNSIGRIFNSASEIAKTLSSELGVPAKRFRVGYTESNKTYIYAEFISDENGLNCENYIHRKKLWKEGKLKLYKATLRVDFSKVSFKKVKEEDLELCKKQILEMT